MLKKEQFFTSGQYHLHYRVMGKGSQSMLLFHGYGQDHRVFYQMATALGNQYKLYCFDLLYHGQSSRPPVDKLITTHDWASIIRHFLDVHCIDRTSLLGYSMGGRLVLSLVDTLSERISELILIAPDGIQSNQWYQFGSNTRLGRALLRRTIARPRLLFGLTGAARKYSIAPKSMLKFVEKRMRTRRDRYQVYCTWIGLRGIRPRLSQVVEHCNRRSILVKIYVGQYDKIVKAKAMVLFHKKLSNSYLHLLPCGHNSLIHQVAEHLSAER